MITLDDIKKAFKDFIHEQILVSEKNKKIALLVEIAVTSKGKFVQTIQYTVKLEKGTIVFFDTFSDAVDYFLKN